MKKNSLKIFGMHDGATPSVFRNAAKLRANMTATEIKLWEYLKTKPFGLKFRRQHPIAGFVLDFYCHKLRLSIEIDGEYHLDREQIKQDNERTAYLKNLGISEVRFTNKQVIDDYELVIETINDFINNISPQD